MSGWLSWVSGKRENKTAARDAIIGLREQLHLITKKEEHLQAKIDDELRKAKENVTTNKRGVFCIRSNNVQRLRQLCVRKRCMKPNSIVWPEAV